MTARELADYGDDALARYEMLLSDYVLISREKAEAIVAALRHAADLDLKVAYLEDIARCRGEENEQLRERLTVRCYCRWCVDNYDDQTGAET